MRNADAIWYWDGTTLEDVTDDMSFGTGTPVSLAQDDCIYLGEDDWISGAVFILDVEDGPDANVIIEHYDENLAQWKRLPVKETVDQIREGKTLQSQAYRFSKSGALFWGINHKLWVPQPASSDFMPNTAFPDEKERYWVRFRNAGSITVVIARILPIRYNTYAHIDDIARFLGVSYFDENTNPTATMVRERIRSAEDWLDNLTRRSWRLNSSTNERHMFNPYGIFLKNKPVWFVTRAELWTGNSLTTLREGRGQDFFVSQERSSLFFNRILFGRGVPWTSLNSRYLRLSESLEVDYVWGEDFDVSPVREIVRDITIKRVCRDIVINSDWTTFTVTNNDSMASESKAKEWREEYEEQAERLRALLIS